MFWSKLKTKALFVLSRPILRIPTLNWLIMCSLSMLLLKLTFHYHRLYTKSSIVATCLTNIVLYSISDTLAQSIASYKKRLVVSDIELASTDDTADDITAQRPRESSLSSIFVDYGEEQEPHAAGFTVTSLKNTSKHSIGFEFGRFFGFVLWGFLMAFIQVGWYLFLHSMYLDLPYFVTVCARVLTDQLCFSPVSLYAFFAYSTLILEHGTRADLYEKIKSIYMSTLLANYVVWVPVQFINFLVMPRNLQVPFSSSVGVLWNCFLSMRNAANSA